MSHLTNGDGSRKTDPEEKIRESEYRKHLASASATGNYFIFRECYLEILSRDAAIVIQKLINKYGYLLKKGRLKKDEFFPYTVEQLGRLGMDKDCQHRILKELQGYDTKGVLDEQKTFIKMTKRGRPPKRHVWIDFLKLNRALYDATTPQNPPLIGKSRSSDPPSSGNPDYRMIGKSRSSYINEDTNVSSEGNGKSKCPPTPRGRSAPPGVAGDRYHEVLPGPRKTAAEEFAWKCAARLFEELDKRRKVNNRKRPNLASWAEHIHVLCERSEFSHIQKVLDWYILHLGEEYVPVALCGASFREKFGKIELAMQREAHQEKKRRDSNKREIW